MAELKVAVASCCSIENRPDQPAWDEIAEANPDVLLLLGDNVYMHKDHVGERVWMHKQLEDNYVAQFAQPQFDRLLKMNRPTLVTWDDHDYGINDAKGGEEGDDNRARTTALFERFWHFRAGKRKGPVHCTADFGPVRFIVLDGRSWRMSPGPDATVLGKDQEDWLWEELARPGPTFTVVACGSTLDIGEPKEGYPPEKLAYYTQFAKLLREAMQRRGHTLYLGGDLHYNAIRQGEGFVEIMTSGVAQHAWKEPKNHMNNWALLEFGDDSVKVRFRGSRARAASGKSRSKFTIGPDWKITP